MIDGNLQEVVILYDATEEISRCVQEVSLPLGEHTVDFRTLLDTTKQSFHAGVGLRFILFAAYMEDHPNATSVNLLYPDNRQAAVRLAKLVSATGVIAYVNSAEAQRDKLVNRLHATNMVN